MHGKIEHIQYLPASWHPTELYSDRIRRNILGLVLPPIVEQIISNGWAKREKYGSVFPFVKPSFWSYDLWRMGE